MLSVKTLHTPSASINFEVSYTSVVICQLSHEWNFLATPQSHEAIAQVSLFAQFMFSYFF